MYYNNDELEDVYEEYEEDEYGRIKRQKAPSKISKIIEQTKIDGNKGFYPNNVYHNQYLQNSNNIPVNNINNNKNVYPQNELDQQNKENNNLNMENNNFQNSQTFNPTQNQYPILPNNFSPNGPYPNTLYQNNPQSPYSLAPLNQSQKDNPYYQNPEYIPNNRDNMDIPDNNNLNYPNYKNIPKYKNNPKINNITKKRKPRPKSMNKIKMNNPNYPYNYNINNTEYPQRPVLNFGMPLDLINAKFRTKHIKRENSPANIPYGYGTRGRGTCFACDVECGISRSGNSPNNYNPYMASLKKRRYDITYYDGEKYGYYQYSPNLIRENN
jgi:hypothetical protein